MTGIPYHLNTARVLAALFALAMLASTARAVPLLVDGVPHESLTVTGEEEYEEEGRAPTEVELTPAVEAAFPHESYAAGDTARLVVYNRARGLTLQVFRVGRRADRGQRHHGGRRPDPPGCHRAECGPARGSRPDRCLAERALLRQAPPARGGRVGFAPFVVRPKQLGVNRVAVVLPTHTWQAYNFRDDDGDGRGDTWYGNWHHRASGPAVSEPRRAAATSGSTTSTSCTGCIERGERVDVLSQSDLDALEGEELRRAYDVIFFPGHHEYVTDRVVRRDRAVPRPPAEASRSSLRTTSSGGSNSRGDAMIRIRTVARPRASRGDADRRPVPRQRSRRAAAPPGSSSPHPGRVVAVPTRLAPGDGNEFWECRPVEIDGTRRPPSPAGTEVVAVIPDLFGPGFTGQMTYYETGHVLKVFAAGAFTIAGRALEPGVPRVLANLWAKLARP